MFSFEILYLIDIQVVCPFIILIEDVVDIGIFTGQASPYDQLDRLVKEIFNRYYSYHS